MGTQKRVSLILGNPHLGLLGLQGRAGFFFSSAVKGLGFRLKGLGFRLKGLGCRKFHR